MATEGETSLFVTSCNSAMSMSCRNKKLLSICIFEGEEIPFILRVAILYVYSMLILGVRTRGIQKYMLMCLYLEAL